MMIMRVSQSQKSREKILGYLLVFPLLLILASIVFYPIVMSLRLSFYNTSFYLPAPKFIGLKNYVEVISHGTFWLIVKNSVAWTGVVVLFQFLVGLSTALLLNQEFIGRTFVRSLVVLPWVMPGIVAAAVWRLMYNPQLGIINYFLRSAGLIDRYLAWLGNPTTALWAVIIAAIWKGFPLSTIFYLAGLQGVPEELHSAAKVDGANTFQRFIYVTLPQMKPIIYTTILLTTVWTFNYFVLIWVMTKGGPGNFSHIFPTYIYELGFIQTKIDFASVYSTLSLFMIGTFGWLFIRYMRRREVF